MKKEEIITFKVDAPLAELLKSVPNRSEFIRHSLLRSLDSVCPLCQGTGILTPSQRKHWEEFTAHHSVRKCSHCEDLYITCDLEGGDQ